MPKPGKSSVEVLELLKLLREFPYGVVSTGSILDDWNEERLRLLSKYDWVSTDLVMPEDEIPF